MTTHRVCTEFLHKVNGWCVVVIEWVACTLISGEAEVGRLVGVGRLHAQVVDLELARVLLFQEAVLGGRRRGVAFV